MATNATLEEDVKDLKNNEFNLQKSYNTFIYRGVNIEEFLPVYDSFINKISEFIIEIKNDIKYHYKPEFVSEDFYQTSEYWQLLLIINKVYDRSEFNKEYIKIIKPENIAFVKSLMINSIKKKRKETKIIVDDLTIREIRV
jgi:hypothetical protein